MNDAGGEGSGPELVVVGYELLIDSVKFKRLVLVEMLKIWLSPVIEVLHISELEGVGVSVTGLIFSEKLKEAPDEILIEEELFEGRIEGLVVEVKGEGDDDEAVI